MTRERKIILAVGLILLIAGVAYRFSPGVETLLVSSEEFSLKVKKLHQYRTLLGQQKFYAARHHKMAGLMAEIKKALLRGKTTALAAVDMQNRIKAVIFKAGIEVKSLQVLKPGDPDEIGFVTIPMKFQIVSTVRQLKDILYGIESSEKMFSISHINSRALRRNPKKEGPVKIRTVMTVNGYMEVIQG